MWKNYDKNSRPDSFYPHSAPIKSRKLQAEFTRHSGMYWFLGCTHPCSAPDHWLFPANSFLHPTPVMQTFPSSVASRKYFPIPGCCKEAALSPSIFEQTNSLAQLQFLLFHIECTAKPSQFPFSSSPRGWEGKDYLLCAPYPGWMICLRSYKTCSLLFTVPMTQSVTPSE